MLIFKEKKLKISWTSPGYRSAVQQSSTILYRRNGCVIIEFNDKSLYAKDDSEQKRCHTFIKI